MQKSEFDRLMAALVAGSAEDIQPALSEARPALPIEERAEWLLRMTQGREGPFTPDELRDAKDRILDGIAKELFAQSDERRGDPAHTGSPLRPDNEQERVIFRAAAGSKSAGHDAPADVEPAERFTIGAHDYGLYLSGTDANLVLRGRVPAEARFLLVGARRFALRARDGDEPAFDVVGLNLGLADELFVDDTVCGFDRDG
ncbi:MAG: hypothetical protein WC729_20345 [Sphingomonas sp.]|jgi:hypothetical protein|uniref:hypothetical protein n=1 Tax=Sphingomonas sp. TaxID=28214 RepID=UPI003562336B